MGQVFATRRRKINPKVLYGILGPRNMFFMKNIHLLNLLKENIHLEKINAQLIARNNTLLGIAQDATDAILPISQKNIDITSTSDFAALDVYGQLQMMISNLIEQNEELKIQNKKLEKENENLSAGRHLEMGDTLKGNF